MAFIFIYGPPGSGKTTLACSMTKLGYKVNIIDPDQKALKMINIKPLVDAGKVVVTPIMEKLTESDMRTKVLNPKAALIRQPKGYLAICDAVSALEKESMTVTEPRDEVLVKDSLTSMIEHFQRLEMHLDKKTKFTFDEWGNLKANLEDYFRTMGALQKLFKHVIITAHETTKTDEDTGRILKILPSIDGSMKDKVGNYFEEVYHTHTEFKGGKTEYFIETQAVGKAYARTSRDLPALVEADFSIIFKEELK